MHPPSSRLTVFKNVLKQNLAVKDEQVLILADTGTPGKQLCPALAELYGMAARELGISAKIVYQNFHHKGEQADAEVSKALTILPKRNVVILLASDRVGSLGPGIKSFRKYCTAKEHRFASTSSLGDLPTNKLGDYINLLDIDYKEATRKALAIKKAMDDARELQVLTKAGTDFTMNVEGMTARAATGVYKEPGQGGNLPGAETYIAPNRTHVNGTIVVDASSRTHIGTNLVRTPIRMEVSRGKIAKMNRSSEAIALEKSLAWAESKSKHAYGVRRVCELSIGLNEKAKLCGSMAIDEKVAGTGHIALGSNAWFGGSIYSIIHLDQVFWKPELKADGKRVKW